ncbi:cobW-domain-containing protein [Coemansia reversa NRRL 1564]|uniref:CobW-domain-containing protein n=1 Tax=Coemansia reversa (strain ATCC 12441 / NRRL 1564) TaxID=763665 RepID=A0A2G5B6Q4_COERN|nr:cobW-domain-containing protein [Coemansia reversa NRRL 1564]|eukprot:PIA14723.1 cobW-domain-containing protein [Coemansia reversa NRRL 1564]
MSSIANPHKSHTVIGDKTTPVTVFTGFLGAGKTTIILNLLKRVDPDYNIVLLKNEFGDAETDSALIRESHIQVTEMTNGCLCCVLVGQMKNALQEMKERYKPDRIIVETSGSAFPAPIAWQIREMEHCGFHLDAILTVIDCINFCGYQDTSYTARLQAKYTDLILLNKCEHVTERQLDIVVDHVNELNTDTPKLKVIAGSGVDPEMIFGLDTALFTILQSTPLDTSEGYRDNPAPALLDHHNMEIDLVEISRKWSGDAAQLICPIAFVSFLKSLPSEDVYRVKGIVRLAGGQLYIVNHAFGRYTFTPLTISTQTHDHMLARITIMGCGLRMLLPVLQDGTQAMDQEITTHWAYRT